MKGHIGSDYGAISNMWFNPEDGRSFVFGVNGAL
jgi:hypothetical protein